MGPWPSFPAIIPRRGNNDLSRPVALAFSCRPVLHSLRHRPGAHRFDLPVQAADRRLRRPRVSTHCHLPANAPRAKRTLRPPWPRCPARNSSSTKFPREADDAVRVHLYGPDGAGRIVYVHPESLAILKSVPHTSRLTEIVRMIHGELLVGKTGSLLVELAASWALIMLGTGMYLWWPRDARGAGGVFYPRFDGGRRVFWRDLHAVSGIWISAFALFLLVTAMPWTTVVGDGIGRIRGWVAPAPQDWTSNSADEHAAHRRQAAAESVATPLKVDEIIARVAPYQLDPPVRLYLPNENQPHWRVRSETQNRPRVRELCPGSGHRRRAPRGPLRRQVDARQGHPCRHRGARGSALRHRQPVARAVHRAGPADHVRVRDRDVVAPPTRWVSRHSRRRACRNFASARGLMIGIVAVALLFPVLGASVVVLALIDLAVQKKRRGLTCVVC